MKQIFKKTLLKIGSVLYNTDCSKILFYHDISNKNQYTSMSTNLNLFKQHFELLKSEQFYIVKEIQNERREIEIHFDDGWKGIYENFEFFIENNIYCMIHIITDRIGEKNYLSKKEINEMLKTGLITLGSHTISHKNLTDLTLEEVKREIEYSKKSLEDTFSVSIDNFCFPRGKFSKEVLDISNVFYRRIFASYPDCYYKKKYPKLYSRSLVQFATVSEFKNILYGGNIFFKRKYLKSQYDRNGR